MKKFVGTIAAAALCLVAQYSQGKVSTQATPQKIVVTASRFSFSPGDITVKKGQPVTLVMKTADVAHGVRFRDLNVEIKSGKETTFTPDKTGDFVGHCSVFCGSGHGAMTLTMHVVD